MARVSLKEAYDNKDVVAQIYAIRDIAEGAEDTANGAVSTANTASEHVDALVPQVEGAVQNANNASASAQQSANTVATYDTRLTEAETKNSQQDTAIGALQTADTQNVKLGGDQFITGQKTFVVTRTKNSLETKADIPPQQRQTQPVQVIDGNDEQIMFDQLLTNTNGTRQYRTNLFAVNGTRVVVENIFLNADGTGYSTCVNPSADAPSSAIVNKAYVESTDGVTNNLLHTNANETILSNKTIGDTAHLGYRLDAYGSNTSGSRKINIVGGTDVQSTAPSKDTIYPYMSWSDSNNNVVAGIRAIHNSDGSYSLQAMVLNANGTEKYITIAKGD